jgi:hypothetical protein
MPAYLAIPTQTSFIVESVLYMPMHGVPVGIPCKARTAATHRQELLVVTDGRVDVHAPFQLDIDIIQSRQQTEGRTTRVAATQSRARIAAPGSDTRLPRP